MHNDFLLCIISKCNNFSANANEAATKTIFPIVKSAQSVQRVKRKLRSDSKSAKSNSYHLRFVPVDPVKHAPSLLTASIDSTVAALNQEDFSLEFCARERCLPYARVIHGRMLLTAFDFNLKSVDAKAVFLLAEATVWMLRNMIGKLVDRSRFKHSLRVESEFDKYKRTVDSTLLDRSRRHNLEPDKNVLKEFELDSELLRELLGTDSDQMEWSESTTTTTTPIEATTTTKIEVEDPDRVYLNQLSDPRQNPAIVSTRRLPNTLYDLKNLLQVRSLPVCLFFKVDSEKIYKSKSSFQFFFSCATRAPNR